MLDPEIYNMQSINKAIAVVTANPMIAFVVLFSLALSLSPNIFSVVWYIVSGNEYYNVYGEDDPDDRAKLRANQRLQNLGYNDYESNGYDDD